MRIISFVIRAQKDKQLAGSSYISFVVPSSHTNTSSDYKEMPVYRTELVDSSSPFWAFKLSMKELCNNDPHHILLIEFWNVNQRASEKIGEIWVCFIILAIRGGRVLEAGRSVADREFKANQSTRNMTFNQTTMDEIERDKKIQNMDMTNKTGVKPLVKISIDASIKRSYRFPPEKFRYASQVP